MDRTSVRRICVALASIVCSIAGALSFAEIEMVAEPTERGPVYHWWPKVAVPEGWAHDRALSFHYGLNTIAPEGVDFDDADSVLYAKAIYKPREPQLKSVAMFIDHDHKTLRANAPELDIRETTPLTTADGHVLRSFTFFPKTQGSWERVAYGEEGDFYLIFTLSARSLQSYRAANSVYEGLIGHYREKPLASSESPQSR